MEKKMDLTQIRIPSPVGPIYLVASEKGLKQLLFTKQDLPLSKTPNAILKLAMKELEQYFAHQRTKFTVPLDLEGTDFQQKVWKELSKISYGKTFSYKEVALKLKNEKAVRAVGTANGKNPICIIIPCHRVIAANGKLGGYSGGLEKKVELLKLEGSLAI
ncbi:MAG: methylated-DNA--[protein]-cysteine S-methyltransferase [Bacteriovoracaceae bacterium]